MSKIVLLKKANKMSKLYKKYLSKEDISVLETLEQSLDTQEVSVAVIGLYNHGKSTLLNVLIDDLEFQTFKTADKRETTVNKTVVKDGIKYIDTPGLNANEHDDKRALDVVKEVDIVLFTHNANVGEFKEKEVEFLHMINKYWEDAGEFLDRTIFVLTRSDEAVDENDVQRVKDKMYSQLQDIFKPKNLTEKFIRIFKDINILETSAIDYRDGRNENESELLEMSNIGTLKTKIVAISTKKQKQIQKTKLSRLEKKYDELIKRLTSQMQNKLMEQNTIMRAEMKAISEATAELPQIQEVLDNKYAELERI